ncbi:MAG: tRNA (guanosine(46)-N7)-methyltransferase TrmB [Clostridia bacterium]|nr:tRNA (guanosine(46)-N7)-methyltransferase TrmB [Clostridia bacterium]
MRIKFKPWAREELKTSPFYIDNPQEWKNKWKKAFENSQELHIELGCGKGNFISKLSKKNQNINYIAIDLIDAMLGMAKRNVEVVYGIRQSTAKEEVENEIEKQKIVKNLKLTRYDISRIENVFGKDDDVKRIYINFCNPWPRGKHHKKRLTHEKQLEQYKKFLKGEIFFKTDDDNLFEDSIKYFERSGYNIQKITKDLASEKDFWNGQPNIETEHERMFKAEGIKIKALICNQMKSLT